MTPNRDPHQALKSEIVSRHNAGYLEVILARLQWAKDDIRFSAHANPSSFSMSGIQQTDLLNYLGFSPSDCSFTAGRRCYVRWVEESFDPKVFADAFKHMRCCRKQRAAYRIAVLPYDDPRAGVIFMESPCAHLAVVSPLCPAMHTLE
jgi:hypothetical protein